MKKLSGTDQKKITGGLLPGGGTYYWSCSVELTDGTLVTGISVTTVENNRQHARVAARTGYTNVYNSSCTASSSAS
jgi:hypothetical protein